MFAILFIAIVAVMAHCLPCGEDRLSDDFNEKEDLW